MPGTNLNQVYTAIGTLTEAVEGLRRDIQTDRQTAVEAQRKADRSRADVHRRLDDLVIRTTQVEADVHSVKERTLEMQTVTDDVVAMRQQVQGAGSLGRWLLKIGGWVMAAAAGAASAYYTLTGRPPP